MQRIDTSKVIDPNVLQPVTTGTIDFIQNTILEYDKSNYQIWTTRFGQMGLSGQVMVGCEPTTYTTPFGAISSGWISLGPFGRNTLVEVVGANTSGFSNPPMLVPTVVYATGPTVNFDVTADPVTFSDASLKSVHYQIKYVVTDTTSTTPVPIPGFAASTLSPLPFTNLSRSNGWFFYNQNCQTFTSSSWSGTITYGLFAGVVRFRGKLTSTGSLTTLGTLAFTGNGGGTTMDSRFRPSANKVFPITIKDDSTYRPGTISIDTSGNITLQANLSGTSSQEVYFDGIEYMPNIINLGSFGW